MLANSLQGLGVMCSTKELHGSTSKTWMVEAVSEKWMLDNYQNGNFKKYIDDIESVFADTDFTDIAVNAVKKAGRIGNYDTVANKKNTLLF